MKLIDLILPLSLPFLLTSFNGSQSLWAQSIEKLLSHQEKLALAEKFHPYVVKIKRTAVLKENLYRPGSLDTWGYGLLLEQGIITHLGWLLPRVDEEKALVEIQYEGQVLAEPEVLKKDENLGLILLSHQSQLRPKSYFRQGKKDDTQEKESLDRLSPSSEKTKAFTLTPVNQLTLPIFPKQIVQQRSQENLVFGQRAMTDQQKDQELLLLTSIASSTLKIHEVLYVYEGVNQPVARIKMEGKSSGFFAYYHLCQGFVPHGAPLFTLSGEVKGISAGPHPMLVGQTLVLPPQAINGLLNPVVNGGSDQ